MLYLYLYSKVIVTLKCGENKKNGNALYRLYLPNKSPFRGVCCITITSVLPRAASFLYQLTLIEFDEGSVQNAACRRFPVV